MCMPGRNSHRVFEESTLHIIIIKDHNDEVTVLFISLTEESIF